MKPALLTIALLTCVSAVAQEQDTFTHSYSWNGFVSQSFVQQSRNKVADTDHSRNEIGVYGSYEVANNLSLRGMFSRVGDDDRTFRTNYLLLDYTFIDNNTFRPLSNTTSGVRVGRVNPVFGFYNADRNSPMTRTWEVPPQSIYQDRFRYFTRSGDGAQGYVRYSSPKWTVDVETSMVRPTLYPDSSVVETFYLYPVLNFSSGSRLNGYNVSATYTPTGTHVRYDRNIITLQSDALGTTIGDSHYVGVSQDIGDTDTVRLEMMRVFTRGTAFERVNQIASSAASAWSVNWQHFINNNWSVQVGRDVFYIDPRDKYGTGHQSDYDNGLASRYFHESYNVGVNWKYNDWLVRAESHFVYGTYAVPTLYNSDILSARANWSYHILTVAHKF